MSIEQKVIDEIAEALKKTEVGYSLKLTRLVDEVSTYTLTMFDGSAPLSFYSTDEAYLYIDDKRKLRQAEAVLEVLEKNGWSRKVV